MRRGGRLCPPTALLQPALQLVQQIQRLQGAQRVYLRPADDIRHGALGHALQGYLVLPRRRGVRLPGLALQLPQDLPRPLEHLSLIHISEPTRRS